MIRRRDAKGQAPAAPAISKLPSTVERRLVDHAPAVCAKCGKRVALMVEGRRISCAGVRGGCGWDCYLPPKPGAELDD